MGRTKEMNEEQNVAVQNTGEAFQIIATMMGDLAIDLNCDKGYGRNINKKIVLWSQYKVSLQYQSSQLQQQRKSMLLQMNKLRALETVAHSAEELYDASKELQVLVSKFKI